MSICSLFVENEFNFFFNIIYILVDDMGYLDIGCFGGEIEMLNFDQFVWDGICFNWFYNVFCCCLIRVVLLIGQYLYQVGMGCMVDWLLNVELGLYQGYLFEDQVMIVFVLKLVGY